MSELASNAAPRPSHSSVVRLHVPRRLFSTLEGMFNEDVFFLILSVFIGIFSGLAVVCFRLAIDWMHLALLGPLPETHGWRLFAVPSLVGLLVAVLVIKVFPGIRGSGVNQTKAHSAPRSESSSAPRSPLAPVNLSGRRIPLSKSEPALHPPWGASSKSRAKNCASWRPWVQRLGSPPLSTHPFPPCSS